MKIFFSVFTVKNLIIILGVSVSLLIFDKTHAMGTQYPLPKPPASSSNKLTSEEHTILCNPLIDIINRGNLQLVEEYFANNPRDAFKFLDVAANGITPLMAAIDQDASDILAYLLLNGAATSSGASELIEYAQKNKKEQIVRMLQILFDPRNLNRIPFLNNLVEIGRRHPAVTADIALNPVHVAPVVDEVSHYPLYPVQQYPLYHTVMEYQQPAQNLPPIDPFAYMPANSGFPYF